LQWQIVTRRGSISAVKLIRPQWHPPLTFILPYPLKNENSSTT
jgi:hypothetical protein